MNLAFFLTPVGEVVWLPGDALVQDAVDAFRQHRYTAVPLLDAHGCYVGTLTEGDLLFHLLSYQANGETSEASVGSLARRRDHRAVSIDTDVRELLDIAADQNFVPVTDSRSVLMGIVTRKAILSACRSLLQEHGLLP